MRLYYTDQQLRDEFNISRIKVPILHLVFRSPLNVIEEAVSLMTVGTYEEIRVVYERTEIHKDGVNYYLWIMEGQQEKVFNLLGVRL